MRFLGGLGVVAIGGILSLGGVTQAFASAGLLPSLELVLVWSTVAAFGLYLIAWGLTAITMSTPTSRRRPTASTSYNTALGVPSAQSKTKRRRWDGRSDQK